MVNRGRISLKIFGNTYNLNLSAIARKLSSAEGLVFQQIVLVANHMLSNSQVEFIEFMLHRAKNVRIANLLPEASIEIKIDSAVSKLESLQLIECKINGQIELVGPEKSRLKRLKLTGNESVDILNTNRLPNLEQWTGPFSQFKSFADKAPSGAFNSLQSLWVD